MQVGEGYWAQVAGAMAAGLNDVIRSKNANCDALPAGLIKESRRFLSYRRSASRTFCDRAHGKGLPYGCGGCGYDFTEHGAPISID